MISMQRAQPHPSATAERPCRLPIMRLQITHQRNLLFQVVESLAIHGLLASIGRIRQSATRSQATMVGGRKKCAVAGSGLQPAAHAEQATMRPSAQRGWIG